MAEKELFGFFKAAAWKSQKEMQDFVAASGQILPPELLKLLELLSKAAGSDPERQRMRCWVFARLSEPHQNKALFKYYLDALKLKDPILRQLMVSLLPRVNNVAEHAALVSLLDQQEAELRAVAGQVLQKVPSRTVVESLTESMARPEFHGRIEAMEVLVQTAGHQAVPGLKAALVHGKPNEKLLAIRNLGSRAMVEKDLPGVLEALATGLTDANEPVREAVIATYSALCSEDQWFEGLEGLLDAPSAKIAEAAVRGLRRFSSLRTIQALDRKIRMGPNPLRLAALDALEAIGTEQVLPPLVSTLSHKQPLVRTRAGEVLSTLSRSGKLEVARVIQLLLRSRDPAVRQLSVGLARGVSSPDTELWPKLLEYLKEETYWVRERIVETLVEMAEGTLARHMVGVLTDSSDVMRRYAIGVLGKLKEPKSLGGLLRAATQDPDWWARELAIEAVGAIGDVRAVPYLLEILARDPDVRLALLAALTTLKAADGMVQVLPLLDDAVPDIRLAALNFVATFNDPRQAPSLAPLVQDPDLRVRTLASRLLATWKPEEAVVGPPRIEAALGSLDRILLAVARSEADDLVITSGRRPMVKKLGKMVPLSDTALTAEQVEAILFPHLTASQLTDLQALKEADFSHEVKLEGLRFRAHVFRQYAGISGVFRIIKGAVPEMEKLGLPEVVNGFGELKNGLVLVGGPTGSGKSTTLAAIIDYINRHTSRHIISLEDPIEVLHPRKKSLVTQRELGTHTRSSARALRATLRQDPDVILMGEMRDYATISFAVTAAETGHLVFGTVHTTAADTTVDRLINAFPAGHQDQVRSMLSESLRAVLCQYLMPKVGGGRVLALEVMLNTDAVSSLIRKGKTFQIPSVVATATELGMQSMDSHLMRLQQQGTITLQEAFVKARDKTEFQRLMDEKAHPPAAAKTAAPANGAAAKPVRAVARPPSPEAPVRKV